MKKTAEILALIAILVIFLALESKYFYASNIKYKAKMQLDYFRYSLELRKAPYITTGKESHEFAQAVPVLVYHGIVNEPDGANVNLKEFKEQMFALKRNGWQTATFSDLYMFLKGEKQLPDKSFLITFDDGRKDSYYHADPILRVLGYKATMFVISKYSIKDAASRYYLSIRELKDMLQSGRWEIQSHGRNAHDLQKIDEKGAKGHFLSSKLWLNEKKRLETEAEFKERIYRELRGAKRDLETKFNIKVIGFAYPFGDFGQASSNFPRARHIVPDIVNEVFPLYQAYQVWEGGCFSFNYPNSTEQSFEVRRITVTPGWNMSDILERLDRGRPKKLPYRDHFNCNNGWLRASGSYALENHSLTLRAIPPSNVASVFLDGAYAWRDYVLKAKVEPVKDTSFSLIARYKDNANFVACDFTENSIRIKERVNGKDKTLSSIKIKHRLTSGLKVVVKVYKDRVKCLLDDRAAVYTSDLNPSLTKGAIGFKLWDPATSNGILKIKDVEVDGIEEGPSKEEEYFFDGFDIDTVLNETSNPAKSINPNWWLSSGGRLMAKNGIGRTIQRSLPEHDYWRKKYAVSNPNGTSEGYCPQNVFRLVTRDRWQDYSQEAYFRIIRDNLSKSARRNESNGLFLFNRYQDEDNVYYTGIRVDGTAVIKKKIHGIYYTMAIKPLIRGSRYDRTTNPNLLPKNCWLGLKSIVKTNSDGSVGIKLFFDNGRSGNWILALEAQDDGKKYGGPQILDKGHAGIRTDFMDVEFDDYSIERTQ